MNKVSIYGMTYCVRWLRQLPNLIDCRLILRLRMMRVILRRIARVRGTRLYLRIKRKWYKLHDARSRERNFERQRRRRLQEERGAIVRARINVAPGLIAMFFFFFFRHFDRRKRANRNTEWYIYVISHTSLMQSSKIDLSLLSIDYEIYIALNRGIRWWIIDRRVRIGELEFDLSGQKEDKTEIIWSIKLLAPICNLNLQPHSLVSGFKWFI